METKYIGVALYRIRLNGCLVGKWSVASDDSNALGMSIGELGTEIASPVKPKKKKLEGVYNVEITSKGKNVFPEGTLHIRKIKTNSYQLSWKQGEITKYIGYGVRRKRNLAANYWAV